MVSDPRTACRSRRAVPHSPPQLEPMRRRTARPVDVPARGRARYNALRQPRFWSQIGPKRFEDHDRRTGPGRPTFARCSYADGGRRRPCTACRAGTPACRAPGPPCEHRRRPGASGRRCQAAVPRRDRRTGQRHRQADARRSTSVQRRRGHLRPANANAGYLEGDQAALVEMPRSLVPTSRAGAPVRGGLRQPTAADTDSDLAGPPRRPSRSTASRSSSRSASPTSLVNR